MGSKRYDLMGTLLDTLRESFEKEELMQEMSEAKAQEYEAKLQLLREELETEFEKKLATVRAEYDRKMEKIRAEAARQVSEAHAQCERRLVFERQEMAGLIAKSRQECESVVIEERDNSTRRVRSKEAQLQAEREVTSNILHVIRELPPLQTAMGQGNIRTLETEVMKWETEALPERFGDCRGVVDAVVKLARERLNTWRDVEITLQDVLKRMRQKTGSLSQLSELCQRLFRALKDAQLTKMNLQLSVPQSADHITEVLEAWQRMAMRHCNQVQKTMIRRIATTHNLGAFDFADLETVLRLVDRSATAQEEVFHTRALAIVSDEATTPKDWRPLLAHLETMIFFLKYTSSEDLALTHAEFAKQKKVDKDVESYIRRAAIAMPPGSELVQLKPGSDVMDMKGTQSVLEEMRQVRQGCKDCFGQFREIFYQWCLLMHNRFDLCALPHHTQSVCLIIFRYFLEDAARGLGPRALVAQVGTGEGKSMIIAALVIYVTVVLKKKVHVIVDDETLLERDFMTFKSLFDVFKVPLEPESTSMRPLTSMLCVSEERMAQAGDKEPHLASKVDPDVDVCYCEAKHVQSFYTNIARGEAACSFESYNDRVLILDEVDALIIDESPNEAFVYPNPDLRKMATEFADILKGGSVERDIEGFRNCQHPAAERVVREMTAEWSRGLSMVLGEDYVYSKEAGRYHAVVSGRANAKAWSLALECKNYQDGLIREINFQERLFVMSRPRVFRKYHRILGLSGSIGSSAEREFLSSTYHAAFFEVPPFLKTCRGSPFHEPVPALLGVLRQAVYVEADAEAQMKRLAEVALDARARVPVLVIAKDRAHCDAVVAGLRLACRLRGLGASSEDLVRSLARTLYETDPEQWKENLNRATLPLGETHTGRMSWRVTVTDPRGARGTDYRVDFKEVDQEGGLLLIPTIIPSAQRDWTQFLGRTARQDRRGQYCAVICRQDYEKWSTKYTQQLPSTGGLDTIERVLQWGDRAVGERIQSSRALYNCGVRMNEICENIFGQKPHLLDDVDTREHLVEVCQRFKWMSVKEINEAFSGISEDFDVSSIPTDAQDLGRPAEPPTVKFCRQQNAPHPSLGASRQEWNWSRKHVQDSHSGSIRAGNGFGKRQVHSARVVVFCLDWSPSMMSNDTGTKFTRFGLCIDRVQQILREQVRDIDFVGMVGFGANCQTVIPPTSKGSNIREIESQIAKLKPSTAGGTCFFDAVAHCLEIMKSPDHVPSEAPRWLICLTDGDDLGSRKNNTNGEVVSKMLDPAANKKIANLNMMMITVGRLKEKNVKIIDSWIGKVVENDGHGQHLSQNDAVSIGEAFKVVAEILAGDIDGAVEC